MDAGQLAQLLKQQIEVHSVESQHAESVAAACEEAASRIASSCSDENTEENLTGLLSPERTTCSGGNAMDETTPEAGSRKRKNDNDLFLLEDERLLQALPAVWPGRKMARLRGVGRDEPRLSFVHSD